MTLDDILIRVAGLLNTSPDDLTRDGAMQTQHTAYVNDALRELVEHGDWPWLYADGTVETVAGANEADLPEDFTALRPGYKPYYAVGSGSAMRLDKADGETMTGLRSIGDGSDGQPYLYDLGWSATAERWQMSFFPRPDNVWSIIVPYRRRVADLVDLDDVPAIPPELHNVLVEGAKAHAAEDYGQMDKAQLWRGKFEASKKRAFAAGANPARDAGRLKLASCDAARRSGEDREIVVVSAVTVDE